MSNCCICKKQVITGHVICSKHADGVIENRLPLGKFVVKGRIQGRNCWVGIDNSDGDAWAEDFNSKSAADNWLKN